MSELLQFAKEHPFYLGTIVAMIWYCVASFEKELNRHADALEKIAAVLERMEKGK